MTLPTFDSHGVARLGEDPGETPREDQILELQRRTWTKGFGDNQTRVVVFDLIVIVGAGDHAQDLTFHGIGPRDLERLGQNLIRLAQEPIP